MTNLTYDERQKIRAALQEMPNLKEAMNAFRALDKSCKITIGSDWLNRASVEEIIEDISCYLAGFYKSDESGKLHSIFDKSVIDR